MTDENAIRAFLAIDLPEETRNQIGIIQDRLKRTLKGVRWTRPKGIHLTLKFFGNVSESDIAKISSIIKKKTKDVGSLTLTVGTIGAFPNFKRPRVLWLEIGGAVERLSILQKEVEAALETCGFQRETRTFRPHLTLGRIKSPKVVAGLSEIIKGEKSYNGGSFTARGLTLFKSDLTPKGAMYTKLAYFLFDQ